MIVLSGAEIVLPDRILTPGTVVIDGDRIAEIRAADRTGRRRSLFTTTTSFRPSSTSTFTALTVRM
jgi:hypothetical protein